MQILFHTSIRYLAAVQVSALILLAAPGPVRAQDPVFQQDRQEMIRELTREPARHRSFVPATKKRAIVVMEKKPGQETVIVDTTQSIAVVDNQDAPGLKLKVEFDTNSAVIRPAAYPLLKELGAALTSDQLTGTPVLVAGHTDSDGTDAYNLRLSLERADAVRQFLVSMFDIPGSRIRVRGYGEAMPLKPNLTPSYKQINRRVEIRLSN